MSKWFGYIGYSVTKESEESPGVWIDNIIEKPYMGDILRLNSDWRNSQNVNDDLTLSHKISIVAEPFAKNNFSQMKYVKIFNNYLKITSVEIQYPRIIITVGEVWNGPKAKANNAT